jgi:DMSO/TMAO reductase YedYZ molybdopterin-dependent catalytic subunit
MSVFVVRHEHPADRCPAADFTAGAGLLNHLSRPSAVRHGVRIRGEAVLAAHTLVMIAEADGEGTLRAFLRPFEAAGTVEVNVASTCARVVAAGGCDSVRPAADGEVEALDPEEACLAAIDAGLLVRRAHPLNCETPLPALTGGVFVPTARFYVRNHFGIPRLDPARWRLHVGGLVERCLSLSLGQLRAMRSASLIVTLECAGNGRAGLQPPAPGEQWGLGAVSTAEWTGVPLVEILGRAGITAEAREIVFRGVDRGSTGETADPVRFERSLSVIDARHSESLLAYAMNGEPLPIEHGYPLRLIVPCWYAVASVKWLTEIEVIGAPFAGFFQTERYVYETQRNGSTVREPVRLQNVRSVITEPAAGQDVTMGDLVIRGVAWSGAAPIKKVEVSVGGAPWQTASLVGERRRHSWQRWELLTRIDSPGQVALRARATDLAGRTQPERPPWNRLGYGGNAVQDLPINVR